MKNEMADMSKKQEARNSNPPLHSSQEETKVRQGAKADTVNYLRRDKYRRRKPKPLSEELKKQFNPANMSPGMKRGMVLSIYKDKIRTATGRKDWLGDFKSHYFMARESDHPILVVQFMPGSIWTAELQMHRHTILKLINERLKCDFLKEVQIK